MKCPVVFGVGVGPNHGYQQYSYGQHRYRSGVGDGADIYLNDNEDGDTLQRTATVRFNDFSDIHFVDGTAASESDNIDLDPELSAD